MSIDKKIIEEIKRHNSINSYILEQDAPEPVDEPAPLPGADAGAPPPPPTTPTDDAGAPPATGDAKPEPIDVDTDDEVEKIDSSGKSEEGEKGGDTEELDVTDLVDSQKGIEQKQEEYFNNLFQQLTNLEGKLGEMDSILNRLNSIESKIEKYREKTPQEKLELRTYDSYPFNQKLSDFFDDKKMEMEKTGKHDYVLTTDDVTDVTDNEIKKTFLPPLEDELT